ncbi:MAG: hypothetical protein PHI48_05550 [Bacteroidales bacterium]|nr:hypothetical protein [Bacteroidales bacterium]
MKFEYKPKPIEKLKADFSRRKNDGKDSFGDFESFHEWYKKKEKVCHYCGISESDCQEIVMTGKLTSNRFPQDGKLFRGQARGMWLEVDRRKPKENYSEGNCVLACYFCNNDKSDVFDEKQYMEFKSNRAEYLRKLVKRDI